ncbi:MAG: mechanosensitive ion channel family protein [Chitinophagales bacterium]|nr:mechanosensitive ion channel family protein [Chitinophagales bacterium]
MIENILEHLKVHWFDNSYSRMIVAASIIVMTFLFQRVFVRIFNKIINKSSEEIHNDPTNYKFLRHAISALIFIVGFGAAIYSIPVLRTLANSMLAGAGILAVAIGFASQQAFSNIISGIFIVLFKPFRVNDRIQIKDTITGIVEDITLRHTVIRNFENRRVIIPNSVISQETLVNSDIVDEKICKVMDIGIGYGSDIEKARRIIQEEAMKHPGYIDNRNEEQLENNEHPVMVRAMGWGDFSVNLRVWIWSPDAPTAFKMGCDLYESIKKRFEQDGVEIPFPYRNVIHHNLPSAETINHKQQGEDSI